MLSFQNVGYAVPNSTYTSEEIASWTNGDPEFIRNKIGINKRAYLDADESSIDLAISAIRNLSDKLPGGDLGSVDLLICVTQNPEYRIPHNSALICSRLGLPSTCASFDLSLGCSGFVYALSIALAMAEQNDFKRVLIVTCDPYSRTMASNDLATISVFGDAAAAVLLDSKDGLAFTLGKSDFGTDGDPAMKLSVSGGGANKPIASIHGKNQLPDAETRLYMNGRSILEFMLKRVPTSVERCLKKNDLAITDIDIFLFHQASKYMVGLLQKRMQLQEDRVFIDITDVGNTVSSSIPIALSKVMDTTELRGKKILISGFGVGLSWATSVITFD